MEAKNTVLSYLKISNQIPMTLLEFIAKLEEQAEISFKAGQEQGFGAGVWAGRKEVLNAIGYAPNSCAFYVNPDKWQAKLKEWSIE